MGIKRYVFAVGFLLATTRLLAQAEIVHTPPRNITIGTPVYLEILIENNEAAVKRVRLFYRVAGRPTFVEDEFFFNMGLYQARIPADYVTQSGVEYFIMAEFVDGTLTAYPITNPYEVPIFLTAQRGKEPPKQISEPTLSDLQGGIPNEALILSPQDHEIVAVEEIMIAVSYFNVPEVNYNSIVVTIDGIPFTRQIVRTDDLITIRPKNLKPGLHTVRVEAKSQLGETYEPLIWTFSIVRTVAESKRVMNYSGRINAQTSSEQFRGHRNNIHFLRGNVSGSYDWLRFDSRLFLTSQEDPAKQPQNRLSAGVKTNYFDLGLGDLNPNMSDLVLQGKRVRGLEANLKLKYFNVHLIKGETERAIAGAISTRPDTLATGLQYSRSGYTFAQNITAVRSYFGSGQYFQLGLSFLKARDDTMSVEKAFGGIVPDANTFIKMAGANKPLDNIVFGTDLAVALDKKRIVWKSDLAISWLNKDISSGPLTFRQLDTFAPGDTLQDDTISFGGTKIALNDLPRIELFGRNIVNPEELADFFIINTNMSPLLPITFDSTGIGLHSLLNLPSSAFRTNLKLNYFNNYIVLQYQRIGPYYNSLGNPFLRRDIQGFTISDKIRLLHNKVFITLSYNQRRNNLDNNGPTTFTSTLTAGFNLYPGEGLPTLNFNLQHYSRRNDIVKFDSTYFRNPVNPAVIDSFKLKDSREDNTTISQNIKISHIVDIGKMRNNINITYTNSERSDQIKDRLSDYSFPSISQKNIRFGLNTTFAFPLKTSLMFGSSESKSALSIEPDRYWDGDFRAGYGFFDDAINIFSGAYLYKGTGALEGLENIRMSVQSQGATTQKLIGSMIFQDHYTNTQTVGYLEGVVKFLKVHQVRARVNYRRFVEGHELTNLVKTDYSTNQQESDSFQSQSAAIIQSRTTDKIYNDVSFFVTYSFTF